MANAYKSTPAKIVLGIFNSVYLFVGLALLVVSLYAYFTRAGLSAQIPSTTLIIGMALGGLFVLTATIGFCSFKARGVLSLYTLLLVILLTGQIVAGILLYQGSLNPQNTLDPVWSSMSDDQKIAYQDQMKCCGFMNPLDRPAVSVQCPATGAIALPGCFPSLETTFKQQQRATYIAVFAFTAIEVTAIFTCFLLLCGVCGKADYQDQLDRANSLNRREVYA